jgi:hypothetical protein
MEVKHISEVLNEYWKKILEDEDIEKVKEQSLMDVLKGYK